MNSGLLIVMNKQKQMPPSFLKGWSLDSTSPDVYKE